MVLVKPHLCSAERTANLQSARIKCSLSAVLKAHLLPNYLRNIKHLCTLITTHRPIPPQLNLLNNDSSQHATLQPCHILNHTAWPQIGANLHVHARIQSNIPSMYLSLVHTLHSTHTPLKFSHTPAQLNRELKFSSFELITSSYRAVQLVSKPTLELLFSCTHTFVHIIPNNVYGTINNSS
ncbi:hypothetical protein vseg_010565 [Gypsophila vaccaria]